MADPFRDELLSLAEAARRLTTHPHVSTLWRWHLRGVAGVRLRTIVIGGRRYTTEPFVEEFLARVNDLRSGGEAPESDLRARKREAAAVRAAATF